MGIKKSPKTGFIVRSLSTTVLGLLLFGATDFFFGKKILGDPKETPYSFYDGGWYELRGQLEIDEQFGSRSFKVFTDQSGFRTSSNPDSSDSIDTVFLGDSFTYGIGLDWEDTFVGIFEQETGKSIVNAGVPSYSPTAYAFQLEKVLATLPLEPGFDVIVALDISDVQDESSRWEKGACESCNPTVMVPSDIGLEQDSRQPWETQLDWLLSKFPLTDRALNTVRQGMDRFSLDGEEVLTLPRSAFTWEDWGVLNNGPNLGDLSNYTPLGVEGGLNKLSQSMAEIGRVTSDHGGRLIILTYPWPAQLAYENRFDWPGWVQEECSKWMCAQTIDASSAMSLQKEIDEDWLETLYFPHDVHFSAKGNRILAKVLIENLLDGQG